MSALAETLRSLDGVEVMRWSHRDGDRLANVICDEVPDDGKAILIGHSFGGDVAASVAALLPRLKFDLILIDPVPVTFLARMRLSAIPLTDNVESALCIRRSRGFYPFGKPIVERVGRWTNVVGAGDHNSVMRSAENQRLIVEKVKSIAERTPEIA